MTEIVTPRCIERPGFLWLKRRHHEPDEEIGRITSVLHLPKARALATPTVSLRRLMQATAEGKTVEWQADAYGDFHAVFEGES